MVVCAAMPARPRHALARDLVALAVLAALVAGGVAWRRAAAAAGRWQTVTLEAEGVRFRLPPGWRASPLGYVDPTFDPKPPSGGLVLSVRSWAIPPEIRSLPGGRSAEGAALEAWAEGQRAGAPQGQRLLDEAHVRIAGVRGVLLVFEDRRDAFPLSVVAGTAHEGRLYGFQVQAGPATDADDAAGTLRRILRTVEWLPRTPTAVDRPHEPMRTGALQR